MYPPIPAAEKTVTHQQQRISQINIVNVCRRSDKKRGRDRNPASCKIQYPMKNHCKDAVYK